MQDTDTPFFSDEKAPSLLQLQRFFSTDEATIFFFSGKVFTSALIVAKIVRGRTMADIISIVSEPITEAVKWAFRGLKRQICYLTKYKENMEKLNYKALALQRQRYDLQNMVDGAERRFEKRTEQVEAWLMRTEEIQLVVTNLHQEAEDDKRCLKGLCPDIGTHRRLSKHALETLEAIRELQGEAMNLTVISLPQPPPVIEAVWVDWVDFESRNKIMGEVMDALRDDSISSVGVFGMGGSGKTTLMKSINNALGNIQLFKKVIMVTVSQMPDWNKIQDSIAARLGLNLEPTEHVRANRLFERLKNEETVLIILEDIWNSVNFAEIGIPFGEEHIGCKILITTRDKHVCYKMDIQHVTEMELLSGEEAWTLFEKKAGYVVRQPNLNGIALEIARKCQGSPLAITALGSSMRGKKDIHEWEDALHLLENPQTSGIQGIMPEVLISLRYSYDRLPGPEIKLCFLFCSLYPEDWDIYLPELRDYGIAEGFLDVDGSLQNASDRLVHYINKLKNCSLLLDGDKDQCVKLHDVVRDVALSIASENENGFLVNIGIISRNWSKVEKLKRYRRISFMNISESFEISAPSECPQTQLSTLLIRNCAKIIIHEKNLFEVMKALVVLHIDGGGFSWNSLTVVPSSLAYLTNLRTLHLIRCELSSCLSVLGRMHFLEILSLRYSNVGILPEEIGKLTNLRCLDLTGARFSGIASDIFYRLSKLEELYALGEFTSTDHEEFRFADWNTDVASLCQLSRLEIQINVRDNAFNKNFPSWSWRRLKDFTIGINYARSWYESTSIGAGPYDYSKCTKRLSIGFVDMSFPFIMLLSDLSQCLSLKSIYNLKNLVDILQHVRCGFEHLEILEIESCNGIENMMTMYKGMYEVYKVPEIFPCLKYLRIYSMENLKKIFNGSAPKKFLGQLEFLRCWQCPKLKNVLSARTLVPETSLQKLETLEVHACLELQEVFSSEWEYREGEFPDTRSCDFPVLTGLRRIDLRELPKMRSIWRGSLPNGSFQNLEKIFVSDCPSLKYMFTCSDAERLENLLSLRVGDCGGLETLVMHCNSNKVKARRQQTQTGASTSAQTPPHPLLEMRVHDCHKLNKLLSIRAAVHCFPQISDLIISNCENLEEIIGEEEATTEVADHHHELQSPHPVFFVIFQNLRRLRLYKCHKLKKVFSLTVARAGLPQLITLQISDCFNLEEIIGGADEATTEAEGPIFQNLQKLKVYNCNKLKKLFSLGVARGGLGQLQILQMSDCFNLEEIVGGAEEATTEAEGHHLGDFLPNLQCLELIRLWKLTRIYRQGMLPLINSGVLKRVHVQLCQQVERLPLDQRCASSDGLKIYGVKKWFQGLVWDDETVKSVFQPFFEHGKPPSDFELDSDEERES